MSAADQNIVHIQACVCGGCESLFYVPDGSPEFLPSYCCYCGQVLHYLEENGVKTFRTVPIIDPDNPTAGINPWQKANEFAIKYDDARKRAKVLLDAWMEVDPKVRTAILDGMNKQVGGKSKAQLVLSTVNDEKWHEEEHSL